MLVGIVIVGKGIMVGEDYSVFVFFKEKDVEIVEFCVCFDDKDWMLIVLWSVVRLRDNVE